MGVKGLTQSLNGDSTNPTAVIHRVREMYQQLIELPPKSDDVTLVVQRTLRDNSDMRVAIRALRGSPDYQSLREGSVWTLGANKLRQRLTESICSGDSNWYMILARIIRYQDKDRDKKGMIGTGVISTPVLRNFLCDYVFCVPRGGLVREKRTSKSYAR